MKIKKMLRLNTWTSLGALVFVILTFAWSIGEVNRVERKVLLIDEMRVVSYERTYLRDSYLLNPNEQAKIQWYSQSEILRRSLESAAEKLTGSEDSALLQDARKNFETTFSSFSMILEKQKEPTDGKKLSLDEAESAQIKKVQESAYALNTSIVKLNESSRREAIAVRNRLIIIIILFIAGLIIGIAVNSIFISRIVTKRVAAFSEGVEIIGGGNLDFRIDEKGDDELSDLARASNGMINKLKESQEFAESVINAVREPLISLDQDLRVVTVSRSFYEFFKVKPEETVGQLIYDLGNKQWDIPKLRELLETILPQKAVFDGFEVEHDFAGVGRRIMLLNARQIQRVLGKERIILLAIEDITERKAIEAGLEKTRKELAVIKIAADEVSEYAESVINTVREPLLVLDQDLRVVTVSRSFYEFFKVKPEETVGQLIYDLGNKQWDIPKLRELLETILPQKAAFDGFEVEHDFAGVGRRIMLLNARQIQRVLGKERIILLAIEDITERKAIETGLEKTRKELAVIKIAADEVSEYAESVINTVREPLLVLDQDLRVVTVSRSFYEFFKVKPEETVGQLIYDLGNKQWDIPKLRELLETILPQKVAFDGFEVEHDFAGVGRRVMLLNARQIQRVWGKERIILLAIEDITERKEIEAGLEKTRKELVVVKIAADEVSEFAESVINTVREPLISLDQDLRVVQVSRSFYEFFKVKPEETVGQLIYDLGNKQWDIPKLRELLETILPQKAAFDGFEVEHDFAGVGRRIMLLNARQIQRVWGKERIILLAIEDITERKEIEAGLEKTRKELAVIKIAADEVSEYAESVINTVREPLLVLDQDLRVVTVSRSFYEFFKVKPEETVGQLIYDLGNKQWDIPKLRELLETILPQKAAFDGFEVEHDFAGVGRRIMLLNARQIQRVWGKERIILLAIEDITERKAIEAGLEKTRKELVKARDAAEASNKELESFSYSVSHDLRAPLRSIDGFGQVLLEDYHDKLDDTAKSYLDRMRKATQHMGRLIDDMLKLSRVTRSSMHYESVDLSAMVGEISEKLKQENPARSVDVIIQEGVFVSGDTGLMRIAMENLINNAWKFSSKEERPQFEFGTIVKEGKITCFVRDNGVGFDMAYVDKLFGAFQRLHTPLEFPGTGIGLATVRRVINRHGGEVWVEAAVGKGATFYFTIPG